MSDENWYGSREEFIKNYRKMSIKQLANYYNKNCGIISYCSKKLGLKNRKLILNDLTDEEIIFMYKSLLNDEISAFTNGLLNCKNGKKYLNIMVRYLIKNILKWNKEDILKKYNSKILQKYKLTGIQVIQGYSCFKIINNAFPEYKILPWQLKTSTVGNLYWQDNKNVDYAVNWFKNILFNDKKINNINEASIYGFHNLIVQYNLAGLVVARFECVDTKFMEYVYKEKFNKKEMLKINFKFDINKELKVNHTLENIIYKITNDYYKLDKIGKRLIDEIIKFCEENKRFPQERDLTIKNGYISRTQYYKYFNGTFRNVYKYIVPMERINKEIFKPKKVICICCGIEKPFTSEYFCSGKNKNKYGLLYTCKQCAAEQSQKKHYMKYGIIYNKITDISPEEWYDYSFNKKIRTMPKICYSKNNLIKVVRYVFINKLYCKNKKYIIDKFNRKYFLKYGINSIISKLGGKLNALKLCFPEYNMTEKDLDLYSNKNMNKIVNNWIKNNNLKIEDILNKTFKENNKNTLYKKSITNLVAIKFNSINDLFLWYFNYNNILHPIYNRKIYMFDFKLVPSSYLNNKNNRAKLIKFYCEQKCEDNILNFINNTEDLKKWIFKYFKSENIATFLNNYSHYGNLYEILVEAYPQIKNNHILFDWEWHQFNKNDKNTLIRELKEFILYRMNNIIIDYKKDIPKYMNMHNIDVLFPKLNKQIDKKRFSSYYEWCCLAFPKYKEYWNEKDFGLKVSKDGYKFDSYIEKDIYEFIKYYNPIFKYLTPIGTQHRNGKYVFKLNDEYNQNRFCPDYVVENINVNGKKKKLKKPIIVEYYGLVDFNRTDNNIINNYNKKVLDKEKFYKSNKNIYYIGIFPKDIKNNYENLVKKLDSFFMQKFSISINKKSA